MEKTSHRGAGTQREKIYHEPHGGLKKHDKRHIFHDILLIAGTAVVAVCFSLSVILGKREIKTDKTSFRRRKRSKR